MEALYFKQTIRPVLLKLDKCSITILQRSYTIEWTTKERNKSQ